MKSKPSSTVPLQLLSRLSQVSTPPFEGSHSQPFEAFLSASTKSPTQGILQTPATQSGTEVGAVQLLRHVPQLNGAVWRSAEALSHSTTPPAAPPAPAWPPVPPWPPAPP